MIVNTWPTNGIAFPATLRILTIFPILANPLANLPTVPAALPNKEVMSDIGLRSPVAKLLIRENIEAVVVKITSIVPSLVIKDTTAVPILDINERTELTGLTINPKIPPIEDSLDPKDPTTLNTIEKGFSRPNVIAVLIRIRITPKSVAPCTLVST